MRERIGVMVNGPMYLMRKPKMPKHPRDISANDAMSSAPDACGKYTNIPRLRGQPCDTSVQQSEFVLNQGTHTIY